MSLSRYLRTLAALGPLCLAVSAPAEELPSARELSDVLRSSAQQPAAGKAGAGTRAKALVALADVLLRLEEEPENVNLRSKDKGNTALILASSLGEEDTIRWLLAHGADPTVKDARGKDALAHARNKNIVTLLRGSMLADWDEALAHLEAIAPEDWPKPPPDADAELTNMYTEEGLLSRRNMLGWCLDASQDADLFPPRLQELREYFCLLGDEAMVSFLSRQLLEVGLEDNEYGFGFLCAHLPASGRLRMLNLLTAHGAQGRTSYHHSRVLAQDRKLAAWAIRHLDWPVLISSAAHSGAQEVLEAGIRLGQEAIARDAATNSRRKTHPDTPEDISPEDSLRLSLAQALGFAMEGRHEAMLRFLLEQERGGCSSTRALMLAAEQGQLELLILLVEDSPEQLLTDHGESQTLPQGLWHALTQSRQEETTLYLKGKLKKYAAPDASWDSQTEEEAASLPDAEDHSSARKLLRWAAAHLSWQQLLPGGALFRSPHLIEAGIRKAEEEGADGTDLQHNLALCMQYAHDTQDKPLLHFLLRQDRGGRSCAAAVLRAAEENQLELLVRLVEDAPEQLLTPDGPPLTLQQCLEQALSKAGKQVTRLYLRGKLNDLQPAPAP